MAYGLLQAGPEFAAWRRAVPGAASARPRPGRAVLVARQDHELSITLNRPHVLNAFNAAMRDELVAALQVAVLDPSVTSVVLRGAGDSFCSGGDLDEFGSRPDPGPPPTWCDCSGARAGPWPRWPTGPRSTSTGRRWAPASSWPPSPAGWWPTAATRISLPEVHLGLIPGAGGTVSLPRRIGRHATMLLAVGLTVDRRRHRPGPGAWSTSWRGDRDRPDAS